MYLLLELGEIYRGRDADVEAGLELARHNVHLERLPVRRYPSLQAWCKKIQRRWLQLHVNGCVCVS